MDLARVQVEAELLAGVLKTIQTDQLSEWSVQQWGSNVSVHLTGGDDGTVILTVREVAE